MIERETVSIQVERLRLEGGPVCKGCVFLRANPFTPGHVCTAGETDVRVEYRGRHPIPHQDCPVWK